MQTYTGHACTSCIFGNKSCNILLVATLQFGELNTFSCCIRNCGNVGDIVRD